MEKEREKGKKGGKMDIFVIGYGQAGRGIVDLFENHGPFEPHRLPIEEMEYTTLPDVVKQQHYEIVSSNPKNIIMKRRLAI